MRCATPAPSWAAARSPRRNTKSRIEHWIDDAIEWQERIGLDVLVHGEFERNDMVKYFAEQLDGFAFTKHGWVQSYGSRCVAPGIIWGDVARPAPMTVRWSAYAQSRTDRPMKGMLTGPVTMLQWSFVRDDVPRQTVCRQLALAIRDEVADLEAASIPVIQVDEPAFREGLPLRRAEWAEYLAWAVACFRLATGGAADATSIHTHMCYAEFNDIMSSIAAMDADVISIETTRSRMELLDAFTPAQDGGTAYPAEIGPGIWDIHSPRVPDCAGDGGAARPGSAAPAGLADLGQSGLRPEDQTVGGGASGAGKSCRRPPVGCAPRHVDCCGDRASQRGPRAGATSSAGTCAVSADLSGAPYRGRSVASWSRKLRRRTDRRANPR